MRRIRKLPLVIPAVVLTCSLTIASVWGYNSLRKIEATVNDNIKVYYDNQEKEFKELDGSKISPVIINGRTYLPLRAVADLTGLGVEWDGSKQAIRLSSSNAGIPFKDNTPIISSTKQNQDEEDPAKVKGELSFWHFNKDELPAITKAFQEVYPNIKINASCIPDMDMQYSNKLTAAIRSGSGVPDVYATEASFVKRFVDMPDALADLTQYSKNYIDNMVPYTVDMGKDKSGILRALSHQITPVAFAYKKGVAKKYLGTDDSDAISDMLSTPENILKTAKILKEKSNGKVTLFPGVEEMQKMYFGARGQGWVVDGKLNIDEKVSDFIDFAKTLRKSKFECGIDQWSVGWSTAIAGDETAMVWECPTWGIPWIIGSNDKLATEGGRWGLAKPLYPSFWGGTWFGIYGKSENKDLAWNFIKLLTTNKEFMKKWALENRELPNNLEIIKEGMPYEDSIMNIDVYKFYEPFLKDIKGDIQTQFDGDIENCFMNNLKSYLAGNTIKTKYDMINSFKSYIASNYKEIAVE